MKLNISRFAATTCLAVAAATSPINSQAATEIIWWHAMSGALEGWVNDLAKNFNESQTEYKVVPVLKGSYD